MVDISNTLVDIWGFFWWSIFDKTPLAALIVNSQFKLLLAKERYWTIDIQAGAAQRVLAGPDLLRLPSDGLALLGVSQLRGALSLRHLR